MIRLFKVRMAEEACNAVAGVLRSGYIGEGPKVKEFEEKIRKFLVPGRPHRGVLAMNSATSAEHLTYHIIKTDKGLSGHEVLTTPLTCTATNWPILANGLDIKWVDVDPHTMNIDLDDLERKITRDTLAITVVHWGGYPVDMKRLANIRDKAHIEFGIYPTIIQDCAHALGSTLHNHSLANWGDFATYSFQAIKHLTCGDGGALVTASQADKVVWY